MKKIKTSHIVYGLFFAFVLFTVVWYFIASTGPGKYDKLAQCLTDKNVTFYGAFWCPACNQQKQILGKSMDNINYVECSKSDRTQNQICNDANIESYPTWEFSDGSRQTGVLTPEQLSERTGCPLDGE